MMIYVVVLLYVISWGMLLYYIMYCGTLAWHAVCIERLDKIVLYWHAVPNDCDIVWFSVGGNIVCGVIFFEYYIYEEFIGIVCVA